MGREGEALSWGGSLTLGISGDTPLAGKGIRRFVALGERGGWMDGWMDGRAEYHEPM